MNATSTLRPSARSPRSVEGPSAMMSPFSTRVADAHQRLLVDAGRLVGALELHQPIDVDARLGGVGLVRRAHDDTGRVDLVDHAGAARARSPRPNRAPRSPPCRCRPAARRSAPAARPGAACSSPSARGWRRRSRGTESAPRRPRRAAWARHPCSRRGRPTGTRRRRPGGRRSGRRQVASSVDRRVGLGDAVFALLHRREIDDVRRHLAVADACGTALR